jgi:hypothetical protein
MYESSLIFQKKREEEKKGEAKRISSFRLLSMKPKQHLNEEIRE